MASLNEVMKRVCAYVLQCIFVV